MAVAKNGVVAICPDCEEEIKLGSHPRQGQRVTCPECWADLEIISLNPPELDFADDEEEEDGWDSD